MIRPILFFCYLFIITLNVHAVDAESSNDLVFVEHDYDRDNRYTISVNSRQFESTPVWNPQLGNMPSIQPAEAIKLTSDKISSLPQFPNCAWNLDSISYRPLEWDGKEKWITIVSYRLSLLKGPASGSWPFAKYVIIGSGEVIAPKIEKCDFINRRPFQK